MLNEYISAQLAISKTYAYNNSSIKARDQADQKFRLANSVEAT